MILNNVELMETELGKILVTVDEIIIDGEISFKGKILDFDMNILIHTPTKESCLEGLKNSFEIQMNFWLYNELIQNNIY